MTILTPVTAVDGTANLIITGTGMAGTPQLVASNGVKELVVDLDVNSQTATAIDINLDTGLASVIANALEGFNGVPLTDSQWSLKWRVGADELGVVVSAPAIYQQREVDNAEKFSGGILQGFDFGTQSQLISPIVTTGGNTTKETESNGKATGSIDGTQRTMAETVTHYIFIDSEGRWHARDKVVINFSLSLWLDGESWVDSEEWID